MQPTCRFDFHAQKLPSRLLIPSPPPQQFQALVTLFSKFFSGPTAATSVIPLLLQGLWMQLQTFLEQQGVSDPRALDLTSRLQRLCQQQLVRLGDHPQLTE